MPKKTSLPKSESTPKAFDVFKPGKSLASATSRPVITGHKPKVQDSTLTDKPGKPVSNARSGRELLDPHNKVVISSPTEATVSVPSAAQPLVSVEPTTPPTEAGTIPSTDQTTNEPEVPAGPPASPVPENTEMLAEQEPGLASVVRTDEQMSSALEEPKPVADTEPADQSSVPPAPTVDTSQIVVSHHKPVGRSKWKVVFVILVVIILAAVAADAILDAGVWSPSYNIPHTHFINR